MQLNGRPIVNYSFVIFLFLVCVCFVGFSVFLYSLFSHSLFEFSFRCACRFDCSRIDQGFLYSLLATRHTLLVTRYELGVHLYSCSRSRFLSLFVCRSFNGSSSTLKSEQPLLSRYQCDECHSLHLLLHFVPKLFCYWFIN